MEITRFRLSAGVGEAEFLRADKALQEDVAYQQPGLLRRTTARGEDGWVVVDLWRSAEDADAGVGAGGADPAVVRFLSLVEAASLRTERYHEVG
jgi:hypothetical protein